MNNESFEPDLRNSQLFLDDSLLDDSIRGTTDLASAREVPAAGDERRVPVRGGLPVPVRHGLASRWVVPHMVRRNPQLLQAARVLRGEPRRLDLGEAAARDLRVRRQQAEKHRHSTRVSERFPGRLLDDLRTGRRVALQASLLGLDGRLSSELGDLRYQVERWHSLRIDRQRAAQVERSVYRGNEKVDGKYRIYGRGTFETGLDEFGNWKGGIRHVTEYALDPFPRKRPVVYTESEDLHNWTAGEQIIKPDTSDPFQMQFYSLSPFRYAGIWLA